MTSLLSSAWPPIRCGLTPFNQSTRARAHRTAAIWVAALCGSLLIALIGVSPAQASSGTISGTAFHDANRDGAAQADEEPFAEHLIYLFDADGYVDHAYTDADGQYAFTGLASDTYEVVYDRDTWHDLWADWVPTTTGVLQPEHTIAVDGTEETAEFGWRRIERSDDVAEPVSELVGGEGLTVQSYVDVVTAQQVYDHLTSEFLIGDEAPDTTVRFGYKGLSSNSTTVLRSDGEVTGVSSTSYSAYTRWISPSGDHTMAHEYGHAWANYHMYTHWDDEWESLLVARGIDPNDDRLGSSHAWEPGEIAADDYRQLFASANAADAPHMNSDLPDAWEVEGYESWLRDEFATGPDDTTDDTTDDDITDDTTEDDTTDDDAVTDIHLDGELSKHRGRNTASLSWTGLDGTAEVFRNGEVIATTDDSTHVDETGMTGNPELVYEVCDLDGLCSNTVELNT